MNEEEEDPRWGGANYEFVREYFNGDLQVVVYRYKDTNRYKFMVYRIYEYVGYETYLGVYIDTM